jgi:hypothetical protein
MTDKTLIDNYFYVQRQKWGTWKSYDIQDNPIMTSLTEELCIKSTRWYLKEKQEQHNSGD